MILAIDASRNRSGGAKAHIIGVLNNLDITNSKFKQIHIWTYEELASELPCFSWLVIHTPKQLNKNIFIQLFWQRFIFPKELKSKNISILLSTDAGTVCNFYPSVVMSRDMLSFEDGEMSRYAFKKAWLRLFLLKFVQIRSLSNAKGAIFLTKYARDKITSYSKSKINSTIIPHGISENFLKKAKNKFNLESPRFIYVSNSDYYKHQTAVIKAFQCFKSTFNMNSTLSLVGASAGPCAAEVEKAKVKFDIDDSVSISKLLPHHEIPDLLSKHDVFIFASSCENMPNTLIEAMASGLPVICSNRGPMPEVLTEKGIFFDPESIPSIVHAMKEICSSNETLIEHAQLSKHIANQFSWNRCARETIDYLTEIYMKY